MNKPRNTIPYMTTKNNKQRKKPDPKQPMQKEPETAAELAGYLRSFNQWRRADEDLPMPHPVVLGRAIDSACDLLEKLPHATGSPTDLVAAGAAHTWDTYYSERRKWAEIGEGARQEWCEVFAVFLGFLESQRKLLPRADQN